MTLRKAVIGVYHKGCWGSESTLKFPQISMREVGPISIDETKEKSKEGNKLALSANWQVSFPSKKVFDDYISELKKFKMIKSVKIISESEKQALINTVWENKNSSYSIVLKNHCLYTSQPIQEQGYEKYEIITDDPEKITKVMEGLDCIGDVKVFSITRLEKKQNRYKLTEKQLHALSIALNNGYYTWPRKLNLGEVAAISGMKRRTFQENLRKAEVKIFPHVIKQLFSTREGGI